MKSRDDRGQEGEAVHAGVADGPSPSFDFTLHGPTANDIHVLKITGFAAAMAIGIMIMGFALAAGLLKLF